MLIAKNFRFISNNPLSRFPQGGKAFYNAPSPVGEGWEGGNYYLKLSVIFMIADTQLKKVIPDFCLIHRSKILRQSYKSCHHHYRPVQACLILC